MSQRMLSEVPGWNGHYCVPTAVAATYSVNPDEVVEIINNFLLAKNLKIPEQQVGYDFDHWVNAIINHFGPLFPLKRGLCFTIADIIANMTDQRTLLICCNVGRTDHVLAFQAGSVVESNSQGRMLTNPLSTLRTEILSARAYAVLAVDPL